MQKTLALALLGALALPATAQEAPREAAPQDGQVEDVALTVYSSADPASFDPQQFVAQQRAGWNPMFAAQVPGFGVVKEVRRLALPEGTGEVRLTGVAQFIDPTTVSFVDVDAPEATAVLEQAFQFDLVSPAKLIERYVDQEIQLREEQQENGSTVTTRTTGTVLSAGGGQIVLRTEDGLRFVAANHPGIRLPSLPDGLITRPTLVWKVASDFAGTRPIRTTYQTGGLTWRADYNIVLSADDRSADVAAWVTLMNLSGTSYGNARLKLIAGDVQRIQAPAAPRRLAGRKRGAQMDGGGFEEKAFFEYHLYTLPRRTDVLQNTTQQIALFPTAHDVATEKVLVYYGIPESAGWRGGGSAHTSRDLGSRSNSKVDVYVKLENAENNKLGMPMPKGKVRVFKADAADGTLEFIGEDLIDHTPRDETVLVKLGQAFDVVGEHTQVDFKIDTGRKEIEETFEIQLRNHKDEDVKVLIRETLFRWANWEILDQTDEYEKVDSRTIHFPVVVPTHGEKTVRYRVRYTW